MKSKSWPVWPDWAIYCTLGKFSKQVATIILLKSPTFLGSFCKGVKIFHFSNGIFWATNIDIWQLLTGHTVYDYGYDTQTELSTP